MFPNLKSHTNDPPLYSTSSEAKKCFCERKISSLSLVLWNNATPVPESQPTWTNLVKQVNDIYPQGSETWWHIGVTWGGVKNTDVSPSLQNTGSSGLRLGPVVFFFFFLKQRPKLWRHCPDRFLPHSASHTLCLRHVLVLAT